MIVVIAVEYGKKRIGYVFFHDSQILQLNTGKRGLDRFFFTIFLSDLSCL